MPPRWDANDIDSALLGDRLEREVERAGIKSSAKIILASANQLRKCGNLSDDDIELLKHVAANTVLPTSFISASKARREFQNRWRTISSNCPSIDTALGGGVPVRGITELYGVSGAGKTQFCLQLSITVQYPEEHGGLGSGCVYICTEDRFPSRRLQQLLPHFPRDAKFDRQLIENASDSIFVDHIPDVDTLKECLSKRLPILLQNQRIGLIIVDSIAALFRADYTKSQTIERSRDIRAIGMQLHKLSSLHNLAILCVNQVTDSLETNETLPALGLVWANLVTTKLRLQVLPENSRVFSVMSSSCLPPSSRPYKVTYRGVEDV